MDSFNHSSSIIETLQRDYRPANASLTAVAYFYFDFNDLEKLALRSLVHSLVIQLLFQLSGTPVPLRDLWARNHDGTQQPKLDDLVVILRTMAESFGQTYIVLDALDECTSPERDYSS